MDIKTILNNVLAQSGFLERGGFASSADPDDKQMLAIANRVAYEIVNYYNWSALLSNATIALQSNKTRYQLPPDYQDLVPNSAWQLNGNRMVEFPVPDGRWFMYKFSAHGSSGTYRVKKYGNEIEVIDPADGDEFVFEYISKWPVVAADGSRKELFTLDDDTYMLDDQVLVLGIQAHWQQAKLMPSYIEHHSNYQRKLSEAIGRSAAGRTIGGNSMRGNSRSPYTRTWVNS